MNLKTKASAISKFAHSDIAQAVTVAIQQPQQPRFKEEVVPNGDSKQADNNFCHFVDYQAELRNIWRDKIGSGGTDA
jgi:hypothetical protein